MFRPVTIMSFIFLFLFPFVDRRFKFGDPCVFGLDVCHELPGEANRTSERKRGDMRNKEYMEAIKEQTQNG